MNSHAFNWKERAACAFAPLRAIDRSWLPTSLQKHARLLDAGMLSLTARRLLYRHVASIYAGNRADVTIPEWARGGYKAQQRSIVRLGVFACARPLRRTVLQSQRAMLQRVVDDATYIAAVTAEAALIADDIDDAYRRAMQSGNIACFIAAMGISVLEKVSPQDGLFVQHTIRCQFSRDVWLMRRTDLTCDRERALEILHGNDHA